MRFGFPVNNYRSCSSGRKYLHIYTFVREEALLLYGFLDSWEQTPVCLLLSVSVWDPIRLGVLDKGRRQVVEANSDQSVGVSRVCPRLGKKTAQKIILELQSKVGQFAGIYVSATESVDPRCAGCTPDHGV